MEEFVPLTTTEGIETGGMKAVWFDNRELVIAHADDEYFIADGRCPHMGGHLAEGILDGTIVTCPRHHSQFDLRDGRVIRWTDWEGAALAVGKLLRHPRPLPTYAVRVDGNQVLMGPAKTPPTDK